jgi:hypothetical protein
MFAAPARRVPAAHLGAVETPVCPSVDPRALGDASLEVRSHAPSGRLEAWSFSTLVIRYRAGQLGIDDGGRLRLAFRWTYDGGRLQTGDATQPNYVTATASCGVSLALAYGAEAHTRPFDRALTVTVREGFLAPGDTVTVVLGDTERGSPGFRLQSFAEDAFTVRVLVDAMGTQHYTLLPDVLDVPIEPAAAALHRVVAPTRRRVGEPFDVALRAEDAFGNPTARSQARFLVRADGPVAGLPTEVRFDGQRPVVRVGPLACDAPGTLSVTAVDLDGGPALPAAPITVVARGEPAAYWADLHGQSGETVGVNTAERYFSFARDVALLDAAAHQANDFQVTDAFWEALNGLTARFDEPGRFVAVPGYEWSGNTGVGGDRNVLFRHEGERIRRSCHALLADRRDLGSDAFSAAELFRQLRGVDAVCFAHVGGRYADLARAHDGRLERSVEVHSCWGTFEWLLADAFRLGHRLGIVANSDDHRGRPGAAHPGAASFGAFGGLTCLLMDGLDRDQLFAALRARRHYATTGARLDLDVRARFDAPAERFDDDPSLGPAASRLVAAAGIGDIVRARQLVVPVEVRVAAAAPIERVEVRRGMDPVAVLRPYGPEDLGDRVRITWEGAAGRGRGRQLAWDGRVTLKGARVRAVHAVGQWSPRHFVRLEDSHTVVWHGVTSGNGAGADLLLEVTDPVRAELRVETARIAACRLLSAIGLEDTVLEAGLGEGRVRLFRAPDPNPHRRWAGTVTVPRWPDRDTPISVAVTLEDGHRAWTSPIYLLP